MVDTRRTARCRKKRGGHRLRFIGPHGRKQAVDAVRLLGDAAFYGRQVRRASHGREFTQVYRMNAS